jgi:hypothetical protein
MLKSYNSGDGGKAPGREGGAAPAVALLVPKAALEVRRGGGARGLQGRSAQAAAAGAAGARLLASGAPGRAPAPPHSRAGPALRLCPQAAQAGDPAGLPAEQEVEDIEGQYQWDQEYAISTQAVRVLGGGGRPMGRGARPMGRRAAAAGGWPGCSQPSAAHPSGHRPRVFTALNPRP